MSNEKKLFKIWSCDRAKKKIVIAEPTIDNVISAANSKGLDGHNLVLEADGSQIDENEILQHLSEHVLIILKDNEIWEPVAQTSSFSYNSQTEDTILQLLDNNGDQLMYQLPGAQNTNRDTGDTTSEQSTLSVTSSLFSSSDIENPYISASVKATFDSFQVPWYKFPKNIIDLCEKGEKLEGAYLKSVIHILVDELRTINYYIPKNAFQVILQKLIEKYPRSFLITDTTGKTITIKNSPIVSSLIQRNNYLNRPTTSKCYEPNIPLKKRKLTKNFENTCKNWKAKPDESKNNDNDNDYEERKKQLMEYSLQKVWNKDEFKEISELMSFCFNKQRQFLNNFSNMPTAEDIKNNWPFLFHKTFIFQHFAQLTDICVENVMKNYETKITKLINYGKSNKENMINNISEKYKSNASFKAFCFLGKFFKEDVNHLFKVFPIGTTKEEIKPPGLFPWIGIVETNPEDTYYIHMDGQIINSMINSFCEAFLATFCLFYNFNIEYPKEFSQSFEFIQRHFFTLYTEASRGKKKNTTAMAKVIRFLQNVNK